MSNSNILAGLALVPLLWNVARNDAGISGQVSPNLVGSTQSYATIKATVSVAADIAAYGLAAYVNPLDSTEMADTTRSTSETVLTCSAFENGVRSCSVLAEQSGTCSTDAGFNGQQCSAWTNFFRDAKCSVIGAHSGAPECSVFGESGSGQPMVCSVISASNAAASCSVLEGGARNKGKCSVTSTSATTTQRCSVTTSNADAKCSVESGTKGTCTVVNGNTATATCSVQPGSSGKCSVINGGTVTAPTGGKCSGT